MAAKLLLPLLILGSGVQLLFVRAVDDNDSNPEIVFNVSDTSIGTNTFINLTCGLKTKDPKMRVYEIILNFNNVTSIRFRNVRPPLSGSKQKWTCSQRYQTIAGFLACRTRTALRVRGMLEAKHSGKVSCHVEWRNFLSRKNGSFKRFRGVKTINLAVSWPSGVDYAFTQSKRILQAPPHIFGRSDVVTGKVNVSCGFIVDSDNADKPRVSGLDSWESVYDNKTMYFNGYNTIHIRKTKMVTLADNGTWFECSIGNHTVRRQLRVRLPSHITKTWPPKNSSVFVGSNISCEAEGDPEVDMELTVFSIKRRTSWKRKGVGKVLFKIPLNYPTGDVEVRCEAVNILGANRKFWKIDVKKMPVNVSLSEVRQQSAGSFLNLSCSTPDPNVSKIFFGFVGRNRLFELRVRPPQFMETDVYRRRLVKLLPYTSGGITVLKVSNSRIDVMLQLTVDDNGKQAECVAIGDGRRSVVTKTFLVSWPPSVKEVVLENRRDRSSPVRRFSNTTVQCKFFVGNPAVPMEVVRPTAKIGDRDLGRGYESNSSPLLSVSWVTQVSRAENGLNITCSFVNRTLNRTEVIAEKSIIANIQYPPSIALFLPADGAALLPSSILRCVSDSNPPALVVLSARKGSTPLREIGRGKGAAEGRLKGSEGRYVVVCEAWNELGTAEQSQEEVLFARPPAVTLTLGSSPIRYGSTNTISCFTAAGDPHLRELQLQFHNYNVTLGRFPISATHSRSAAMNVLESNGIEPVMVSSMPFSVGSKRLSVQRLSTVSNRIDVQLKVVALDHNQNVTCRAIGVQEEFNVTVQKKIQVSLSPKLEWAWCCIPAGAKYSKVKKNNFTLVARVQVGIPAVKMNVSFVSDKEMETPELQGPSFVSRVIDENGQEFLTQMWSFTVFNIDKPFKKIRVVLGSNDAVRHFWLTWRLSNSLRTKKFNGKEYQCQVVFGL